MYLNEKDLSHYIDSLNNEKKPKEHDNTLGSNELEELLETVHLVRSIKEPVLHSTWCYYYCAKARYIKSLSTVSSCYTRLDIL